ncbi:rhomboid family intramembrane serine protease [Primorskyibacter sp. S187A]|uniref:rhomboid family intramembrane serine protease n=1 Tax=Primorskyibacter sp. S187A TaxID=3415130 RepID=UPI003C7D6EBD
MTRLPFGILAVMGLVLVIEAALTGADYGLWGTPIWRFVAFLLGAFNPAYLSGNPTAWAGQAWGMFLTHPFLHISFVHMASNMLTLYLLWYLLRGMSQRLFLGIYAISAIGGALAFALLAPAGTTMTGASGAISGLAAVWVSYEFSFMNEGQILYLRRKRILVLIGLLVVTVGAHAVYSTSTAWQTHLGGAIAGLALTVLVKRPQKP